MRKTWLMLLIIAANNPNAENEKFNLCGGEKLNYLEMVKRIFTLSGKKPRFFRTKLLPLMLDLYSTFSHNWQINGESAKRMSKDLIFDDSLARDKLSWSPRKFLSGGKKDIGL